MKVLFLGCHSDDIELGCAATINKHKEDWDIACCVFCTQGYKNEKLEDIEHIARNSLKSIGVEHLKFYKFSPDNFYKNRQEIWIKLKEFKKEFNPDVIFTQIADEHQDHVTLNQESIRVFREKTLISYMPIILSQRSLSPDTYEIVSNEDVVAKLKCISYYREFYKNKNYLSENNVVALLRANGIYVQSEFAESYKTITRIGV